MDSSKTVYNALKEANINFIVSLPCINLGKLLEMVECDPEIIHVPVTREEEGFGIAAGAYLGGKNPGILMQNSGLGNSVNVLASLYELYQIPIIMIISHRGTEGEPIVAQIPMGKATPEILKVLKIPYYNPKIPEEAFDAIKDGWNLAKKENKPVGILLEISYW
ncbi:MAG: sulfopyruvate decarboxylase subunit alpha [Methanomicrobiales archaeon]